VVVHVDAAVLADAGQPGQSVLEDGQRVPAGTSQRLACDASRVVRRHDAEGRLVEVGARTRAIPPALRRALQFRDRGCRFPGCRVCVGQAIISGTGPGRPHHAEQSGPALPPPPRRRHEEGYQVERLPDGELQFRRPNGWVIPESRRRPPRRPIPSPSSVRATRRTGWPCTQRPRCRAGWGSGSTWEDGGLRAPPKPPNARTRPGKAVAVLDTPTGS
jgi:hypothetical protein